MFKVGVIVIFIIYCRHHGAWRIVGAEQMFSLPGRPNASIPQVEKRDMETLCFAGLGRESEVYSKGSSFG